MRTPNIDEKYKPELKKMGKNIRKLIDDNGFMQKDVASALEIDQGTLSYALNGERPLSLNNLFKIADFFDTNLAWIAGGGEDPVAPKLKTAETAPISTPGIDTKDIEAMKEMREKGVISENIYKAFVDETMEKIAKELF